MDFPPRHSAVTKMKGATCSIVSNRVLTAAPIGAVARGWPPCPA
jgi:hypothetical protein